LRWLVLEERDRVFPRNRVFPRKGPTIPDVGRRSSKGEAELQRCLTLAKARQQIALEFLFSKLAYIVPMVKPNS
jgi:hypothetical protein